MGAGPVWSAGREPGEATLLILPLIDLLILLGTGSLAVGFVIKVINVSTRYSPTLLGFHSLDFVVIAAIFFAFAMTLVARTWMKLNEPKLASLRRNALVAEARMLAAEQEFVAHLAGHDVDHIGHIGTGIVFPLRNPTVEDSLIVVAIGRVAGAGPGDHRVARVAKSDGR